MSPDSTSCVYNVVGFLSPICQGVFGGLGVSWLLHSGCLLQLSASWIPFHVAHKSCYELATQLCHRCAWRSSHFISQSTKYE